MTAIDKEAGVVADPKVLEASGAPSRARKITRKGDVIYSCVRPYLLNVAVIETDFDPPPIASTALAIRIGEVRGRATKVDQREKELLCILVHTGAPTEDLLELSHRVDLPVEHDQAAGLRVDAG